MKDEPKKHWLRRSVIITPIFAWYDLWVGFYWDRKSKKLYVLPLPMVGVVLDFSEVFDEG